MKNTFDCPVPLRYGLSMDWLHENAVVTTSCIWRSNDGEPWLLTFDFADVGGRLECVGMRIRSFIEAECEDEFGSHRVHVDGEVSTEDFLPKPQPMPELDLRDHDSRVAFVQAVEGQELKEPHPARFDTEAVDAVLRDPEGRWAPTEAPRPLRTATLRELPLGDVLARLRKGMAADWRSGVVAPKVAAHPVEIELPEELGDTGEPIEEIVSPERRELEERTWQLLQAVKRNGGYSDDLIRERDELSELFAALDENARRIGIMRSPPPTIHSLQIDRAEFVRLTQHAASSFSAPGQKAGRPTKYSPAQLELVAKTYREAFASGSPSPTKDVAETLGLSRARAAKLVMRCRDPRVGLLGPTAPREAGGIKPQVERDQAEERPQ